MTIERKTPYNSTYKKLAVQWLNEALSFVSSFVVADSLVLRNRQLLVAAKRCTPFPLLGGELQKLANVFYIYRDKEK